MHAKSLQLCLTLCDFMDLGRRAWQPTQVFLPGESHGQRSLAGYGPWSLKDSGMIEVT